MAILPLLCIVSVAFTGLTKGAGVLPAGPLNAAVGGSVMFTTTLTPQEKPFISVAWSFDDKNIITSTDKNITAAGYEGRITFFLSTGSLELRNLTLNDSGEYRVTIIPSGEAQKIGTTRLDVYEPVSNVTATPSSTDLVEFSDSAHLSCSSSGSSLSFLWMNDSSKVIASDRVQLTDGGATLTIVNVTRHDQGPFLCHVSNPVSNGTSDPVNLSISYGPENINLIISPPQQQFEEGSNISLICSADSRPPAMISWFLNGNKLIDTGPELKLMNIKMSQNGSYSCQASNNKTQRNEISQPSIVSVLERISGASVTSSTKLTIEGNSVNLTCEAAGSIFTRMWMKDGSDLNLADNMILYDNNRVLSFHPLKKTDSGEYYCNISNPVSSDGNKYSMVVYYGPENVQITGPSEVEVGETLTLTCSAESEPSASYTWTLNGTEIHNSSVFTKNITGLSASGNYTCGAMNNITGRTSRAVHGLSVTERISGASVTSSTNLTIEGNSVNLTCEAAGSIFTRMWMKDGSDLNLTDNMILYDNNRVLSFHPLNRTDSGEYYCNISNPVSSDGNKYSMVVIYGPENVQITGPSEVDVGETLTLTCSAESEPSAGYTWMLNGTEIHNSSVFTEDITGLSASGNYTCEAMNNITGRTSRAVHGLSVTEAIQEETPSFPPGYIAAIVIACLVVCGAAAGGGYYIYYRQKQKKKSSGRNTTTGTGFAGGEGQENTAYSGSEELNYADIRYFPNNNGGTVQMELNNSSTQYAQVYMNNSHPAADSPPSYDAYMQQKRKAEPQLDAGIPVYAQIRKP